MGVDTFVPVTSEIEINLVRQCETVSHVVAQEAQRLAAESANLVKQAEGAAKKARDNRATCLGAILRAHGISAWEGCIEVVGENGTVQGLRYRPVPVEAAATEPTTTGSERAPVHAGPGSV